MMTTVRADAPPVLEDLYREHYASLVRLAAMLVDDVATCEEVVQDAFVAIHRRGLENVPADRIPAYLRSAVLNGARSQLRKRHVRRQLRAVPPTPAQPSPERGAELHQQQQIVLDALRSLSDRQRDVLVLRYWMELSETEIAETLDISPGTVKTHAKRGLEALATRLEDLR
jgi:RNA polymerase sigma-70 factor (sigma-E family)